MISAIFCLRFAEGQTVTAQLRAANKTEDAPVSYAGAVERLPLRSAKANAIELRAYFKSFARELRAEFSEQEKDDRVVASRQLDETLEHLLELGGRREKSSKKVTGKLDKEHQTTPCPLA